LDRWTKKANGTIRALGACKGVEIRSNVLRCDPYLVTLVDDTMNRAMYELTHQDFSPASKPLLEIMVALNERFKSNGIKDEFPYPSAIKEILNPSAALISDGVEKSYYQLLLTHIYRKMYKYRQSIFAAAIAAAVLFVCSKLTQ